MQASELIRLMGQGFILVIARSKSDEAIQQQLLWIASLRSQ
jgi:hypothetical protein